MAKKKVKRKTASDAESEETFEQALAALEAAVADLESGELGLEESLTRYEQGVARLKRCHAALERAQRRIELLSGVDAEGNPITRPFPHEEAAAGEGVDGEERLF